MERLTDTSRDSRDCSRVRLYTDQRVANQKLWEYENAGLEPSEVVELQDKLEEAQQQFAYECGCNAELVATQKENEEMKNTLIELSDRNIQLEKDIEEIMFEMVDIDIHNDTKNELWEEIDYLERQLAEKEEYIVKLELWLDESRSKLSEKEELLKNAICPKFKVGQEVWVISNSNLKCWEITEISIDNHDTPYELLYSIEKEELNGGTTQWTQFESQLFATKEEAQKKLEELR